jgi:UPF0716 protein FxsA
MALLLLLILTPVVEMYVLIRLGGYFGAWPTIALVIATAVVGVALLRRQGPAALNRVLLRLQAGELPARELAEGALLAAAGLLLLMPGFVTDTAGFLLLVPGFRRWAGRRLLERFAPGSQVHAHRHVIIEGQFERRSGDPARPADRLDAGAEPSKRT